MNYNEEIFIALGMDGYEYCHPIDQDDFELIASSINGESRLEKWNPLPMDLVQWDGGRRLLRSDSPWLGDHALIFRAEVVVALRAVLAPAGEFLPLKCRNASIFVFNPLNSLPALDENRSSVIRFDDGRVMMVEKYSFIYDLIDGVDAFKISNLRVSPTFFSRRIVDIWKNSGFTGLEFKRVA